MTPTPRTLRDKWMAYRSQRPRSFDGSVVDEVALEREDALMEQFIRDLLDSFVDGMALKRLTYAALIAKPEGN